MSGLDEGGFARRRSKAILGEQFEHVLKTECEGRSSYGAVSGMRFLYRVMKYSELHTPASRLTQIRRGRYLLANFNLELEDF
jgi:hypothetical protein